MTDTMIQIRHQLFEISAQRSAIENITDGLALINAQLGDLQISLGNLLNKLERDNIDAS